MPGISTGLFFKLTVKENYYLSQCLNPQNKEDSVV